MIGHEHTSGLVAAERQHTLRSEAALYHGSHAIDAKRAARRAKRGPSIILRLARRAAQARSLRPTVTATTAWTPSATPPA